MPRFFFHKRDHSEFVEELEGEEFPDLDAARRDAEAAAREMMAELLLRNDVVDGRRFEIANSEGEVWMSYRSGRRCVRSDALRFTRWRVAKMQHSRTIPCGLLPRTLS